MQDWPQFKDSDPADVLWRIITGQRGISSLEVAVVAQNLMVDPLELVTGEPDPLRMQIVGGPGCKPWIDQMSGEEERPEGGD